MQQQTDPWRVYCIWMSQFCFSMEDDGGIGGRRHGDDWRAASPWTAHVRALTRILHVDEPILFLWRREWRVGRGWSCTLLALVAFGRLARQAGMLREGGMCAVAQREGAGCWKSWGEIERGEWYGGERKLILWEGKRTASFML